MTRLQEIIIGKADRSKEIKSLESQGLIRKIIPKSSKCAGAYPHSRRASLPYSILLSARKSKNPGEFKDKNKRAGNTEFVDLELVPGTLKRGFDW